jgi:predicted nuclease with RNAse H fold
VVAERSEPVLVLGVDLASRAERTAACLIEWSAGRGRVRALRQPADDEVIHALAEGATRVAIDAPLGWPTAFVDAVMGHGRGDDWSSAMVRSLRFRDTDAHVYEQVGWWPLSVSTDLIGIVAFRAARLLTLLEPGVARDGSGRILEVYPAAAMARWDLPHRGYKGAAGTGIRTVIVDGLDRVADVELAAHRPALIASDDLVDALVAALVGVAAELGRVDPIPDGSSAVARIEGWIRLPAPEGLRSTGTGSRRG